MAVAPQASLVSLGLSPHLTSSTPIDEDEALSVAEGVMRLENRIKAAHLAMLIRIKNALTDAQQSQLDEIRRRSEAALTDGRPFR